MPPTTTALRTARSRMKLLTEDGSASVGVSSTGAPSTCASGAADSASANAVPDATITVSIGPSSATYFSAILTAVS